MGYRFDFDTFRDRTEEGAIAVTGLGKLPGFSPDPPKEGYSVIPMWVADMSFPTAPAIMEALQERAKHPAFGYFAPKQEYYDSIIRWHAERHGVQGLEKKHIGYENGVLGGVISALNVFCPRGAKVLVHSPTYIGFTGCLTNNGYDIVHSPLVQDADGIYRMDYDDMETKLAAGDISATILCSPHNPTGRVWEREELERAMALFEKYDVGVVSDEIWSDIILPGYRHVPTQQVSEDAKQRTVALYAPSKTFNLAGLIGSYHIVYNDRLHARLKKQESLSHYNDMNTMSMSALIGAYSPEGAAWADELCQVIGDNAAYARKFMQEHFPGIEPGAPQGTYMFWVNCAEWLQAHGKTIEELEKACWDVGVALQDGKMFHGPTHLRLNLALPPAKLREAMDRLKREVFGS